MDLHSDLETLVLLSSTFITEAQRAAFEPAIASLNAAPKEDLERAVVRAGSSVIGALLSLPERDQRGQPLTRLRDDVILTAVEALLGPSPGFRSLGLLPPRLTTAWAGPKISGRAFVVLAEIQACPAPAQRIEGWLALLEHLEGTFERKGTATLEVIASDAVYRPLGDLLRSPVSELIRALLRDVEATPSVDRDAVFLRAWKVLRHGWIEVMRHASVDTGYRDESALLASLADTPERARAWCAHLEAEPASVRDGGGMRRLRFELAKRAGDADVMMRCLPGKSTTWAHHEAIVKALGGRRAEAIAYLEALPPSAERDRTLSALLKQGGATPEALAMEIILPHKLDALAQTYGVSRAQLIELGATHARRGDEVRWLEFFVQPGAHDMDPKEVRKIVQKLAPKAGPEALLRVAARPLAPAQKSDLLSHAVDALFSTKTEWRSADDAARIGRDVLTAAATDPTGKKLLAQARKKVSKALDGNDFFLRQLAIALEGVLDGLSPG